MNNSYYETLDENFNEALSLIEKPLSHNELIELLRDGNIPQKQLAALRLETLASKYDAEVLIGNLVGQDGKIREAVSLKIKELSYNADCISYFQALNANNIAQIFLLAITDINGNICRNIIEVLGIFKNWDIFVECFTDKLTNLIFELIDIIKDFDFQDGKYKVNKEVFKLYWCLEALNVYYNKIPVLTLKKILLQTKNIEEYTIREKTAKILSNKISDETLMAAREELKNDKNYYVRRF